MSAIKKLTSGDKALLDESGVRSLPDTPKGYSAAQIKAAMRKPPLLLFEWTKAISDTADTELNRIENKAHTETGEEYARAIAAEAAIQAGVDALETSTGTALSALNAKFNQSGSALKAVADQNGSVINTTYATQTALGTTNTALGTAQSNISTLQSSVSAQGRNISSLMTSVPVLNYDPSTHKISVKVFGKTSNVIDLPLELAVVDCELTEDGHFRVKNNSGVWTSYDLNQVLGLLSATDTATIDSTFSGNSFSAKIKDGSITADHLSSALKDIFDSYSAIASAETSRASAELTRQGNEADRQENERNRLSAEDERASAETARATAFASMQTSFNALQSSLEASEYRIALLEKDLAEANFEILTLKHFVYDTIVSEAEYDFSYLFLEPIPTSIDGHLVLQNGEIVIEQAEGNSYGFNQQLDTISYWGSVLSVKKNADGSLVVNGTCGSSTETIYLKNNNTMNTSHKYLIGVDKQGSSTTYGLRHGSSVFYGYLVLNGNNGAVALDLYQNYVASNLSLNIAIIDLTAMGEADISSVAEFKSRHPEIDLTKPLPYCKGLLKSIGSHGDGTRMVENQVCNPTKAWEGSGASCTSSGNDFSATITSKATWVSVYKEATFAQGHKYLVNGSAKASEATSSFRFALGAGNYTSYVSLSQDEEKKFNLIATATSSPNGYLYLYPNASAGMSANATLNCNISSVIDLTLMFGSGKEPSSLSEFLALRPHYFEALHPYDEGTEMSLEEAEKTAWVMENQVIKNNGFDGTDNWDYNSATTITTSGGVAHASITSSFTFVKQSFTGVIGHKYFCDMNVRKTGGLWLSPLFRCGADINESINDEAWHDLTYIVTCTRTDCGVYPLRTASSTQLDCECDRVNVIDLTAMFGYGNEPTSVDEFKARLPYYRLDKARPYNAGTLRALHNTEPFAIEVKGGNLWDEQWEKGDISQSNGSVTSGNYIVTKNFIKVKPSTYYYFVNVQGRAFFYDEGGNYISNASLSTGAYQTPSNCYKMRFRTGATYLPPYNNDIAVFFGSTPLGYKPYRTEPLLRVDLKPFPDGDFDGFSYERHNGEVHIRKDGASSYDIDPSLVAYATINEAGSVSDRIYARLGEDGLYEIVKETKVGSVDLGSLAWSYVEPASAYPYGFFSCSGINGKKQNNNNITANGYSVIVAQPFTHDKNIVSTSTTGVYAVNSAYTSASTFKSAMSGVTLFYELATPTTSVLRTGVHQSEIFGLLKSYPASAIEPLRKAGSVADRLYFEQYAEDEEGDRLFRLVRETKVKCVDLGSVSMTYNSTSDYYYFVANDIKTIGENVLPNILATYTTVLYTDLASSDKCVTQSGSSNIVRVKDTSLGSSTQPKGCLLYELATPVTEVLRDNLRENEIACLTEAGAYLELKGGVVPSKVKTTLVVNKLEA